METIIFLRMNIIHDYNTTMGIFDISDQLWVNHCISNEVQNGKWWWLFVFWYIGVVLIKTPIMYVKVKESNGVEKRDLIFHHNFHKAILLAWIYLTKYRAKCTTPIDTISTRISRKRQYSSVSTASLITIDSSLKSKNKSSRRVCSQVILHGGMLAILLDSSYDFFGNCGHQFFFFLHEMLICVYIAT